jgi:polyhydroxyalkanoate synthesis repressor PhaR
MSAPRDEAPVPRLDVRKYPNRRYYDTTHSRHVTLEAIHGFIRGGHDVTVTDSRTGADITAQVLTQILLEFDTAKLDSFPVSLLLRVIRVNDPWMREFVETYFDRALAAYLEYQKQIEDRVRQFSGLPGIFPPLPAWVGSLSSRPGPATAPGPTSGSGGGEPAGRPVGPGAAEVLEVVDELRQQVAELKQEVAEGRSRRSRRR